MSNYFISFFAEIATACALFTDEARKELNLSRSSAQFFFRTALKPLSPTLPKREGSLGVLNTPLYSLSMVLQEPDTTSRKNLLAAAHMSQIPHFWKFSAARHSLLPPHKVFLVFACLFPPDYYQGTA